MALPDLSALDKHRVTPVTPGTPDNVRQFFAPVDDAHGALVDLINSASHSLIIGMYGANDDELLTAIGAQLASGDIYVQVTLDSTQAGGVHERELLAKRDWVGNSLITAIGQSEKHAIQHLKMFIIDGTDLVTGSMNWGDSAETKQDNHLLVVRDPILAAEARSRIDIIHDTILQRAAEKK